MLIDKNKIKYDYFTFDGAISKAEFVRSFLIWLVAAIVVNAIGWNFLYPVGMAGILFTLVRLVFIIALFSISIRRLRDLGQSELWSVLLLFPPLGILLIIYLLIAERRSIL